MAERIKIFNIPFSDFANENFSIEITDDVADDTGQDIVEYMRNRNLTSAWLTTGSTDAANTEILCNISDSAQIDDFFLVGHNLKDFDVDYWNGVAWVNLAEVLNNTSDFYHLEIPQSLLTDKVRITVYATITADEDKRITRLIITDRVELGEFKSWPVIERSRQKVVRKKNTMLSGRKKFSPSTGGFSVTLKWKMLTYQEDVDIIEYMYLSLKGVMIWLSGGDEDQFRFNQRGYRNQDFYIVQPDSDLINAPKLGIYSNGVPMSMPLEEVV